ncbi:hypothetical protein [Methylocaldum szegediense]|jgi:hypothetical protein|uniref:Uncharacterized protein n=1 Tax=Methylocaldum szegediense TaxID=73780 RepID=A0ABM9I1D2_9GAMM|nr:hypothetical protein [Methylocaldum szegediense]CAI8825982.1 conserved protein of unknown function [Methylocaldum szegediense]
MTELFYAKTALNPFAAAFSGSTTYKNNGKYGMTLVELNEMLRKLDELMEMGKPHRYLQLRMLSADIRNHYLAAHQDLNRIYRDAWDQAVLNRLDGMTMPTAMQREFLNFRHQWRARTRNANLRIYFGQMRVGPDFQGAQNIHQGAIVGFPQHIVGRPLVVVAGELNQGDILGDQIPLQIFYHNNKWIAANNRCYTTHCLAGVRPLRIIPRLPEQLEINRLAEVEGQNGVGNFTYQPGVPHLAQNPRRLPSDQMPITQGQNSWVVQQVATVPLAWQ